MIGIGTRLASALAALAILSSAGPLAASEDDAEEPRRLEIKHVGRGDRVTIENGTARKTDAPKNNARKAPAKVLPFAEDEEQEQQEEPAAEAEPERGPSFQPRFKPPAVRKAAQTETAPQTADEQNTLKLDPIPLKNSELPATAGRALVDQAFAKSKVAKADSDFTEVIELCRKGLAEGLKRNYEDYTRRLMGWSYNRRGELRAAAHKDKEALADFEVAVELHASWRAVHNRAVSYGSLGRIKEALADFDRAIELNKNYPNAYFNRGELRCSEGDIEGALRDYTAAIDLGPADAAMYNSRAHALGRLQQYGEALRDYAQALEVDPNNAATLIFRGDTYADMGNYSEAARDYREAVRLDPKLGRAYQSAAWLMATCPDEHYLNPKLAIEAARKAIALDGDRDFRYLETLAAAQAADSQFTEAKETQERAIAIAPRVELVPAEKRMALYQRDLAYRDPPKQKFTPLHGEEPDPTPVRKASATSQAPRRNAFPNPFNRNQGDGLR
jgi:tetratricopeptide (TPR) repeat protein